MNGTLQLADKYHAAFSGNWLENSILGDKAIIVSAATYKDAMERKASDQEDFDWWFKVKEVN
ncbi:hypothetical protein [Petrotoga sp. 9PWA.NaAc.5.4]|uniref:hypothetical protein n=1 Tax=Petrotoga sp. 9PWA.NaAc.5.4 TaxID=1434328 RepID=UPI0011B71E2A|nr:hypothetical protein [Petrotoga sp. 9PWA.NaAc.5.4]